MELLVDDRFDIQDYSATFSGNMSLPLHKWYRYTAGFSAEWAKQLILEEKNKNENINIIDPFAGSGTVIVESDFANVNAIGIEAQPYIYKIAKTKLAWEFSALEFEQEASKFLKAAKKCQLAERTYPKLIVNCYPPEVLEHLERLRQTWISYNGSEQAKDFLWFVITSILRVCSPVGTAQWQYIQPNKKKAKVIDPYTAFEAKVKDMCGDMQKLQKIHTRSSDIKVVHEDSRNIESIPSNWGDLVITSPPYANNYDYADATRLEMTFWGDINGWSDLQDGVRTKLIRACTQHVSGLQKEAEEILNDPALQVLQPEFSQIFDALKIERLNHGGKKNYHLMIAMYFKDLSQVFSSLRRVTKKGCRMCFVIGDSAPYGIYVPVDRWLGELAISSGFKDYSFEKLRDRNVKWKNRKHTVPLKEGRLWING